MENTEKEIVPLIMKILYATQRGDLKAPFTTAEMKEWVIGTGVINDKTEKPYANNSLNAILPNSDTKNIGSTNENSKILKSRLRGFGGKKEYWFESF